MNREREKTGNNMFKARYCVYLGFKVDIFDNIFEKDSKPQEVICALKILISLRKTQIYLLKTKFPANLYCIFLLKGGLK